MTENSSWKALGPLMGEVRKNAGARLHLTAALIALTGLTEGLGLMLLIPLLGMAGLGQESGGAMSDLGEKVFAWTHLPRTIPAILVAYALLVAVHAAARRQREVQTARVMHGTTRALRKELFRALSRVSWTGFVRFRTSDLAHVLLADVNRTGVVVHQTLELCGLLVIALFYFSAAALVSWPLTLLAAALGLVLAAVLRPRNRKSRELGMEIRSLQEELFASVQNTLGGMKEARSMAREEAAVRRFDSEADRFAERFVRFETVGADQALAYEILAAAAIGLLFYTGIAWLSLPLASMILMVFVVARILPRIQLMQRMGLRIIHTLPSYESVADLRNTLAASAEPVPSPGKSRETIPLKTELRLQNVSFSYPDAPEKKALSDISVTLRAGKIIGLAGPSGSGKTTFADLVVSLIAPQKGAVFVDNERLTPDKFHAWRRSVGTVAQDGFLFFGTVRENLVWTRPEANEKEMNLALEMALARDFVEALPQGVDTVIGERGARISGGERQRLALARAILTRPSLLVLDEATSHLDEENEKKILENLKTLAPETTVLLVAHRVSALSKAEQIILLENGGIRKTGTWDEFEESDFGKETAQAGQSPSQTL